MENIECGELGMVRADWHDQWHYPQVYYLANNENIGPNNGAMDHRGNYYFSGKIGSTSRIWKIPRAELRGLTAYSDPAECPVQLSTIAVAASTIVGNSVADVTCTVYDFAKVCHIASHTSPLSSTSPVSPLLCCRLHPAYLKLG